MTVGEMVAAGASSSDIGEAIANAARSNVSSEIPGTGMTSQQMLDAGATPQQVSEITQAANAPGGIMNPANASLMPSVGDSLQSIVPTLPQVAEGAAGLSKAVQFAQKYGLLGKKNVPATTLPDGTVVPAHVEEASLISNPYVWAIGAGVLVVAGLAIKKASR
jgi:alkylhydroperoxidase/carboxymuconolactone decarboxylase family protein YurZ